MDVSSNYESDPLKQQLLESRLCSLKKEIPPDNDFHNASESGRPEKIFCGASCSNSDSGSNLRFLSRPYELAKQHTTTIEDTQLHVDAGHCPPPAVAEKSVSPVKTPGRKRNISFADSPYAVKKGRMQQLAIPDAFKAMSDNNASSPFLNKTQTISSTTNTTANTPLLSRCDSIPGKRETENSVKHSSKLSVEVIKKIPILPEPILPGANDTLVTNLKKRIEQLEQKSEDTDKLLQKAREEIVKILKKETENDREKRRARMLDSNMQLGELKTQRIGAIYEDKWCPGQRFQELERRRKVIEQNRAENEKLRKMLNKKKGGRSRVKGASPDLDGETDSGVEKDVAQEQLEYNTQAEIHDLRKITLNGQEKDLQTELERLEQERMMHIKESKRIISEDESRFNDCRILDDRYMLLSMLGKGGFSEVFKAFDLHQMCYVACKIHELHPTWQQEKKDNYYKHAQREISIHRSLDHRRIVKVFNVFNIDNDAFCTVLEYCEGNDLDSYLKQKKCLSEREAKLIMSQVVSALRYLNSRKHPIIHYDLKPANILLCLNGDIKITDFGLSKIFPDNHQNAEGMELTSQGAGTYWYLPPECFVTDDVPPRISSKVDVWSVGVIFYQCLYGKKPFGNDETQRDILYNNTILRARQIQFPDRSNSKVSDDAKRFIERCCTYDKDRRPDVLMLSNDDYFKSKTQQKQQ